MKTLRIAKGLDLPLDVVTQKLAFLGRTGSGKTYAATKLAELMLDAGAQVVVLDQVGVWHGLRLGPDAFPIPVLGGLHGDVPLEATGGALVADLIVDRTTSAVLDVSQFLPSEQARFATDFATRFFQRKKASPSAVHVFLEECQEVVPQNHQRGEERMLHAFERLVKLGRNFGIGVSLISQRPQEVNKKALNQTECLFALQLTGPHERKAVAGWVADKGLDDAVHALLPKLQVGQAHVWSPAWLGVSKTVQIAKKRTLDTSSTPTVGGKAAKAGQLTPIDLEGLRQSMADTIEKAKADDPRALRKRIAELEKILDGRTLTVPDPVVKHVFDVKAFGDLHEGIITALGGIEKAAAEAKVACGRALNAYRQAVAGANALGEKGISRPAPRLQLKPDRDLPPPPPPARGGVELPKGERAILTAVAQHRNGVTREQLTVLTGYKRSSRDTYLQKLRAAGHIEVNGSRITATDSSIAVLGHGFEPLPTGVSLRAYWLERLPEGERRILEVVLDHYPRAASRDELSERTGYKRSSRDTYVQKLRARQLVITGSDGVTASEALFE